MGYSARQFAQARPAVLFSRWPRHSGHARISLSASFNNETSDVLEQTPKPAQGVKGRYL